MSNTENAKTNAKVPDWKEQQLRDATPYCLGCEKEGHRTDECHSTRGFNTPRDMEITRLAWIANGSVPGPKTKEFLYAENYRWLRQRHWFDSSICVVMNPKSQIKLGTYCPSGDLLDEQIARMRAEGSE